MTKTLKRFILDRNFWILLILGIFFMPMNLATDSESVRNSIVSSVGVDKTESGYEVTLLSFVPTPGKEFVETYNAISTKGETISQALTNSGLQTGKIVKLFHTDVVVLGESILNDDVVSAIDYFVREESIPSSCFLVGTNGSAKDLLTLLQQEEGNPGDKISRLLIYNSDNLYTKEATVESFFDGFYSPTRTSFIPYLKLEESEDDQVLLSQESSDTHGVQNGKKINKKLKNAGEIVLFKEGKKNAILEESFLQNLNLIAGDEREQNIVIYNDDTDPIQKLVFYIDHKKSWVDTKILNNVPIYSVSLLLYLSRVEVLGGEADKQNISYNNLDQRTQKKIEEKIKRAFSETVKTMRETQSDLMEIYYNFYQNNRKDFKKYLNLLSEDEFFLDNVLFEIMVGVIPD